MKYNSIKISINMNLTPSYKWDAVHLGIFSREQRSVFSWISDFLLSLMSHWFTADSKLIFFISATVAMTCNDPGTPQNGTRYGDSREPGDTISFQCDPGYKIQGVSEITCVQLNSRFFWQPDPPTCIGEIWLHCVLPYHSKNWCAIEHFYFKSKIWIEMMFVNAIR